MQHSLAFRLLCTMLTGIFLYLCWQRTSVGVSGVALTGSTAEADLLLMTP